jgi:hypothetical protein
MQITNENEFEAGLEEALQLLQSPTSRSRGDQRLKELLEAIDAYRPTFDAGAPAASSGLSARAAALVERAAELKTRYDEREKAGLEGFANDGQGIGPTTGV